MLSPSRRTVVTATVALAIVVAAVALPLFQPWRLVTDTVTNTVVDEALPDAGPVSISTSSPAAPTISGTRSPGTSAGTTPPRSPDRPAAPERLSLGSSITHEHETTGTASVVRLPTASGSCGSRASTEPTSRSGSATRASSKAGPAGTFSTTGATTAHQALSRIARTFTETVDGAPGQLKANRDKQGNQNYAIPAGWTSPVPAACRSGATASASPSAPPN